MSTQETATAVPETPATGVEESRFTDAKIAEAFGETPEPQPVPETPAPAPTETAAPAPAPVAPETAPDEGLKALDDLIGKETEAPALQPEAPKPPAPQQAVLTPELAQVEHWKSNPELAKKAVAYATQMHELENAFASGDMPRVQSLFDPNAWEYLKNHVWNAHKDEFLQRAVDEQSGVKADPRVDLLTRQIAEMRSLLTERQRQELAREQSAKVAEQQRTVQKQFNDTWDALFSAVKVTDAADRTFLGDAVMGAIYRDPAKAAKVQAGDFRDVQKAFRDVYSRWITAKKAGHAATAQTLTQQATTQSGKLATASAGAPAAPADDGETDFTEDGERKPGFWAKGMAALGLDK